MRRIDSLYTDHPFYGSRRIELEASGAGVLERTIDAIRAALEAAGVEFTNGEEPECPLPIYRRMKAVLRLSVDQSLIDGRSGDQASASPTSRIGRFRAGKRL
jgi:hypothetical protein